MLSPLIRGRRIEMQLVFPATGKPQIKRRGKRVQEVHCSNHMTWNNFKVDAAVFTCALKSICIAEFS